MIIFQENRSVDNLFNGFPGADTVQSGLNSSGQSVPLQPIDMTAPYDLDHSHHGFTTEYANGSMNGFDRVGSSACGTGCPPANVRAYGYVPRSQTGPYWAMAQQYAFADRMFQTNQGPSFPAHQYIIGGTSLASASSPLLAAENPAVPGGGTTGGCDAPSGTTVALIDPLSGDESQRTAPCLDHPTLLDLLDAHGVTWRYYQPDVGAGLWFAPDAISHIRYGADYANVRTPSTSIFTDIQQNRLAQVSWVIPTAAASDHARATDGSGPAWVASVVNAIGTSPYWSDTAIFVTWDDWGGWYDHAKPQQYNAYELGFRVPLIVISPYARAGYVSHVQHEFGSILRFTEAAFGLGTLGYTDARADDLSDCFDLTQPPIAFRTVQANRSARDFMRAPQDRRSPDTDEL
ncbi:MAG TPA: alkaline phosphatase family protein [Candidatus Limnocylindrales bacterium]|nr:alkaline phosphatase family protein [Candidatus Limnocylindrales bacterium]